MDGVAPGDWFLRGSIGQRSATVPLHVDEGATRLREVLVIEAR